MNSNNADAGAGAGRPRSSTRTRRSRANTATRSRDGARSSSSAVVGKVREGLKKKLGFYTDMMSQLDMIVFAELCTLYYMDCSFFRFIVRAAPHSFFLSPKSEDFVIPLDARKPHVFAIFGPSLLCLLAHSLGALPRASEANRGYLHGGMMIDFIGQKAPTSSLGLVLLDLVVLVVQCLMLAIHTEREKLRRLVSPIRSAGAAASTATRAGGTTPAVASTAANTATAATATATPATANPAAAPTIQQQDAAERGAAPRDGASSSAAPTPPANNEPDEDERLRNIDLGGLSGAASPEEAADNALDALSSGTNIGDFYIIHAIRQAMQEREGGAAAAQSLQSIGYAVTLARLAAQRRTRARAAGTVQTAGQTRPQ